MMISDFQVGDLIKWSESSTNVYEIIDIRGSVADLVHPDGEYYYNQDCSFVDTLILVDAAVKPNSEQVKAAKAALLNLGEGGEPAEPRYRPFWPEVRAMEGRWT